MNHLYQLVYSSTRTPSCTEEQIQNILKSCERNNAGKNITGVLLHSDNNFVQYLEGDKDIIKLYDLIKDDPRHTRVVLLSYGPLKERVFPSWHMGYKNISRNEIELITKSTDQEQKAFNALLKNTAVAESTALKLLTKFFNRDN